MDSYRLKRKLESGHKDSVKQEWVWRKRVIKDEKSQCEYEWNEHIYMPSRLVGKTVLVETKRWFNL